MHMNALAQQIRRLPVLESVPEVKFENRQRSKIFIFYAYSKSEKRSRKFLREVGELIP